MTWSRFATRARRATLSIASVLLAYVLVSAVVGLSLRGLLLFPARHRRTEAEKWEVLDSIRSPGAYWTDHRVLGGRAIPLRVHWLHRPRSRGVAILIHGFGDDAYGTVARGLDLPSWDVVVFTLRGRDHSASTPCTLGGWERRDLEAVVEFVAHTGVRREDILLVGTSQGAGVALLGLATLERHGPTLAGALLESPWRDLPSAARDHLRGELGSYEPIARLAERVALLAAEHDAEFDLDRASPIEASRHVHTRLAILTGSADTITPLVDVRAIAEAGRARLTVVPGGRHVQLDTRLEGGWAGWADRSLRAWGLTR